MSNIKYIIAIGKYDHKLGPVCLIEERGQFCNFFDTPCMGIQSLMKDAIIGKGENIYFEAKTGFYQVIKISIPRPNMRGKVERFVIIVKIPKGFGILDKKIINSIKEDFVNLFKDPEYQPSFEEYMNFKLEWEKKLLLAVNPTENLKLEHFIRNKLNVATGFLQLILLTEEYKKLDEKTQIYLNKSILNLFEIDSALSNHKL